MLKEKGILVCFFILISFTIGLRIYVEETSYLSPDSRFYLRVSENLLEGNGLVSPRQYPFDQTTEQKAFCLWPAGYPVLITGVSLVTGLNVFVASKVVNLIAVGGILILFFCFYREKAIVLGLVFCFYGVLEVYSYTWSEGVFIAGLLGLWQIIVNYNKSKLSDLSTVVLLSFVLSFLFLIRYAGIVYVPFVGFLGLYYGVVEKKYNKIFVMLRSCVVPVLVVSGYFCYNYVFSGSMSGSERVFPFMESVTTFIGLLLQGIMNELAIARNYYYSNYTDYLYVVLLVVQLAIMLYVFTVSKKLKVSWEMSTDVKMLFVLGGYYFVAIVVLRKISPFDPFNYRILAPFSFPCWVAVLMMIVQNRCLWREVKVPVVSFMLLSLVMNLPKAYLLSLIGVL